MWPGISYSLSLSFTLYCKSVYMSRWPHNGMGNRSPWNAWSTSRSLLSPVSWAAHHERGLAAGQNWRLLSSSGGMLCRVAVSLVEQLPRQQFPDAVLGRGVSQSNYGVKRRLTEQWQGRGSFTESPAMSFAGQQQALWSSRGAASIARILGQGASRSIAGQRRPA